METEWGEGVVVVVADAAIRVAVQLLLLRIHNNTCSTMGLVATHIITAYGVWKVFKNTKDVLLFMATRATRRSRCRASLPPPTERPRISLPPSEACVITHNYKSVRNKFAPPREHRCALPMRSSVCSLPSLLVLLLVSLFGMTKDVSWCNIGRKMENSRSPEAQIVSTSVWFAVMRSARLTRTKMSRPLPFAKAKRNWE